MYYHLKYTLLIKKTNTIDMIDIVITNHNYYIIHIINNMNNNE